jgi:predicted SAM-dependent methyltransferase
VKLHIGCMGKAIPGFKRLDAVQWGDVDYVQDARDLSNFESNTVEEIYASHILEHFSNPEVPLVLKDWNRAIKPGGTLWVSVPDFDAIVEMYLRMGRKMSTWIHHLIHGDQGEPYHTHYQSFTYPVLSGKLSDAGFNRMEKVKYLPYGLSDASVITDNIFNLPISINIKAVK